MQISLSNALESFVLQLVAVGIAIFCCRALKFVVGIFMHSNLFLLVAQFVVINVPKFLVGILKL